MAIIRDQEAFYPLPTSWDDLLLGTDEDDTLYPGKGNDTLVGGAGIDTVVWGRAFIDADVRAHADGSVTLGGHTLREIEFIRFADVTLSIADALPRVDRPLKASRGDDRLVGDDHGFSIDGDAGNDTLTGLGGDDSLYGGKGEDTAVYRGQRADYRILYDYEQRCFVVLDGTADRDGRDTLQHIEQLQFADGALQLPVLGGYYDALTPEQLATLDGVIGEPPEEPDWSQLIIGGGWLGDGVVVDHPILLDGTNGLASLMDQVVETALIGITASVDGLLPA